MTDITDYLGLDAIVVFQVRDGVVTVVANTKCWQTRNDSTIKTFTRLYSDPTMRTLLPQNKLFIVYTGDSATQFKHQTIPVLTYSTCPSKPNALAIPDFTFEHWPEVNLPHFYDEFYPHAINILKEQPLNDRVPKLLWIGAETTPVRRQIVNTYKNDPNMVLHIMNWQTGPLLGLYDHAKFRYLLDIEGGGYSARLKYLFMLGSVVFVIKRDDEEYWWKEFVPWVDYVPVARNATDLSEVFNRILSDQTLAAAIAIAGHQKACTLFDMSRMHADYARILSQHTPDIYIGQ